MFATHTHISKFRNLNLGRRYFRISLRFLNFGWVKNVCIYIYIFIIKKSLMQQGVDLIYGYIFIYIFYISYFFAPENLLCTENKFTMQKLSSIEFSKWQRVSFLQRSQR